ncbi:MAG TPA: GNAT family N-acetyltransferase [Acidimicrobiales bacterium]|jgi:GNAT superfamily N-acetyltransferase|nr:GNAT family N-acetyltransferase [Acidimicrobiales bacterium]
MREGARRADRDDLPRLAELYRTAAAQLSARRGGALLAEQHGRAEPVEQTLDRILEERHRAAWVGTVDDHVVGYATGRTETLAGGTELGVVEELFVESGARGVGVGEALMAALLAWFVDRGCAGVDTMALPGDRLSKNFFESSGFKARLIVMHRALPPDSAPGATLSSDHQREPTPPSDP